MEGKKGLWLGIAAAVLAAAGAGLYWKSGGPADVSPPNPPVQDRTPVQVSPLVLPKLEESDGFLRDRLKSLSDSPKLSEWLVIDNLIRRVTAAVAIIAEGKSPRDSLKFLAPGEPFAVKKKDGKVFIDPRSYARYDLLAGVIGSLPAEEAARVFTDLKPLFQQAYEELGAAHGDFQAALLRAIDVLLAAPSPGGDVELCKKVLSYALADDALEALSPAQKHLLRMGPKNAALIQDKLRSVSRLLKP